MENPTPAKGSRSSDDQYELAIRILAHFRDRSSGRGVQWAQVTMPGRNLKSMQNLFTKINEDIKALGIEPASPEASSAPLPPPTVGKKRGRPSKTKKAAPKMMENDEDDDEEDELDTPSKPPPKRKRAVKSETSSEETDDIKQEVKQIDEDLIKADLARRDASDV